MLILELAEGYSTTETTGGRIGLVWIRKHTGFARGILLSFRVMREGAGNTDFGNHSRQCASTDWNCDPQTLRNPKCCQSVAILDGMWYFQIDLNMPHHFSVAPMGARIARDLSQLPSHCP